MTRAIDVGQMIRYLLRRWPLFMLTLAVSSFVGYIYTSGPAADTYEAKTILYCPGSVSLEINEGIKAVTTSGGIINSEKIAGDALVNLSFSINPSRLRKAVRLSSKAGSAVYNLTALYSSPEQAVELSNAMADAFIRDLSGDSGIVVVYEYAVKAKKVSDGKISRRKTQIAIPAVSVAGVVAGTVLYAMMIGKGRSVAEAALYDEKNIFGVIAKN